MANLILAFRVGRRVKYTLHFHLFERLEGDLLLCKYIHTHSQSSGSKSFFCIGPMFKVQSQSFARVLVRNFELNAVLRMFLNQYSVNKAPDAFVH